MKSIQLGVTEIAGYRLMELVGSGGMGNVYKAYHAVLQREAAVKILHQQDMAERFKNEAYIQSSVSHPNIARLYEYLPLESRPCIIMEYVQGLPLDDYLRSRGKLSNTEAENVVRQVAGALAYLHGKGIVHRDIKPQNFKIQPDGIVKMLDFGIAKNKYTPKLTQLGFVVGTTEYMAPEQFHQQPELKSDIWSLGIMTYELLTGYLPFESPNPMLLRLIILKAHYTNPAILLPNISVPLETIIEKSLRVSTSSRLSALQITQLLSDKKEANPSSFMSPSAFKRPSFLTKAAMIRAGFILAAVILLSAFIANWPAKKNDEPGRDENNTQIKALAGDEIKEEMKVKINTPSIENASIIFSDGITKTLPYEITGRKGDNIEFIIHADGYADKKVQVEITNRRSSYEYNLEKLKE